MKRAQCCALYLVRLEVVIVGLEEIGHEQEVRSPAEDAAVLAAHNTIAFMGDGIFFNLGSAFIEASTVLPTFVGTLTRSPLLIGFVSTIRIFGYFVPQIFVAGYIQRLAWKKPFMMRAGYVMRGAVLGMALAALLGAANPGLALAVFYACVVVVAVADGFGGLPWMDIVARTIPSERRSGLFGRMQGLGGVAAFFGGFGIQRILGAGMRYPYNYALVMFLGFVFLSGSLLSMHFIRDPGGRVPDETPTMKEYLRRLPGAWRQNTLFQKVVSTRLLMGAFYLALPFFAIHAQTDLHFAPSLVGLFVSAQMAGIVGGGPLWGYLGDRHGARWVVRLVTIFTFLASVLALAARAAYFAGLVALAHAIYFILYVLLGASFGGAWIGFTAYVLDIAPDDGRATLIGLFNTISAPLTLLTVVGGWFLGMTSFPWLFAVESACVFASVLSAWRLPDSRDYRT